MKIEKVSVTCTLCGGQKVLPRLIAKQLPKYDPNKKYRCTQCKGRGFEFKKPK